MARILLGIALVVLVASCGQAPDAGPKPSVTAPARDQAKAEALNPEFTKDVLHSKLPVLVDFWAPWCGPCLRIAPAVEEIGETYAGKVKVVKINVDDAPAISEFYEIKSIPTLILYKNGVEHRRLVGPGGDPKKTLTAWLDTALQ